MPRSYPAHRVHQRQDSLRRFLPRSQRHSRSVPLFHFCHSDISDVFFGLFGDTLWFHSNLWEGFFSRWPSRLAFGILFFLVRQTMLRSNHTATSNTPYHPLSIRKRLWWQINQSPSN